MALVTMTEAAKLLGVSTETVKRRLKRGELHGQQQPRPQGFVWLVEVPDSHSDLDMTPTVNPSPDGEMAHMESWISWLQKELEGSREELRRQAQAHQEQLEAKDKQIEQLHVLLQQAQAALPAPKHHRSWWRFWQR